MNISPDKTKRLLLALCLSLSLPATLQAQQQRLPFLEQGLSLSVEADSAELSQERNVSIYRGNVRLQRGPLELRGDTLTISRDEASGRIRAELEGSPARASYTVKEEPQLPVKAHARSIVYTTVIELLELRGQASIERGSDRISGESVRYEIPLAKIQAEGGEDRVRITIQPPSGNGPTP